MDISAVYTDVLNGKKAICPPLCEKRAKGN